MTSADRVQAEDTKSRPWHTSISKRGETCAHCGRDIQFDMKVLRRRGMSLVLCGPCSKDIPNEMVVMTKAVKGPRRKKEPDLRRYRSRYADIDRPPAPPEQEAAA